MDLLLLSASVLRRLQRTRVDVVLESERDGDEEEVEDEHGETHRLNLEGSSVSHVWSVS